MLEHINNVVQITKIIVSFHPTIEKNFPGLAYEIAEILGRFAPQINMKFCTHPLPPSTCIHVPCSSDTCKFVSRVCFFFEIAFGETMLLCLYIVGFLDMSLLPWGVITRRAFSLG
jgi:hypothetical protein